MLVWPLNVRSGSHRLGRLALRSARCVFNGHGGYGLGKGSGASDLDNVVYSRAVRPLADANTPIRMMTVVDGMIGPKGANPLQLLVGGNVATTVAPIALAICSAKMGRRRCRAREPCRRP